AGRRKAPVQSWMKLLASGLGATRGVAGARHARGSIYVAVHFVQPQD
ncbi:hypothetical protein A2U01_0071297, partial [Trifolium medium]|nr:hypothetical protein [Trifolium medium]